MDDRQFLLLVGGVTTSALRSVETLHNQRQWSNLEIVVLTPDPKRAEKLIAKAGTKIPAHVLSCFFETHQEISSALAPFFDKLVGVICRSDKHIQYLRRVIPLLPPEIKVASVDSLTISTNKRLMREAFQSYAPAITPRHILVKNAEPETLDRIEQSLKYPAIIKPANLTSSLLIHACESPQELKTSLIKVFETIELIYQQEERLDAPEVIVEEYLEGEFYSIDAYVLENDDIYLCPPVYYVLAKRLGVDDFFLYKRTIPIKLTGQDINLANDAAKKAIQAVGLSYSAAHIELVRTKNGWKIIELGPRLGRFRTKMYQSAYGIDHSLNDVKLHLGLTPVIPTKLLKYCSAYSIYPYKEGVLKNIQGLEAIIKNPKCIWYKQSAKTGDQTKFAKHGGHALAEFIVATDNIDDFKELTSQIEKTVFADIDETD